MIAVADLPSPISPLSSSLRLPSAARSPQALAASPTPPHPHHYHMSPDPLHPPPSPPLLPSLHDYFSFFGGAWSDFLSTSRWGGSWGRSPGRWRSSRRHPRRMNPPSSRCHYQSSSESRSHRIPNLQPQRSCESFSRWLSSIWSSALYSHHPMNR